MEIIQRIWQENRRFILQVGSGVAVFLFLQSCVIDGCVSGGAKDVWKKNQDLESQLLSQRSKVLQRYPEEKKNLEELEKAEADLGGRFLTPTPKDVPDPKRGAPQIQFSDRIDRFWSELRAKANTKNVRIPEKITNTELGVQAGGDTQEDLARSAAYLEILTRALMACVDQGMVQIEKPQIHPEEALPVRENDGVSAVYRRVGIVVQGPYEAFKRILREYQAQGPFIQVRLVNLDSKGASGGGALKGLLEFTGIFFEKEGEAAAPVDGKKAEAKPGKAPASRIGRKKSG